MIAATIRAGASPSDAVEDGRYGFARGQAGGPVRLRCGVDVTIRPIRPDDLAMARSFVRGLSRESCYQRLLSSRRLLPGELQRLMEVDHDRRLALTATADLQGHAGMLAVARCEREPDRDDCAELAIVVTDRLQRCGLGEALLSRLMIAGKARGIRQLRGITLSSNTAMRGLARKLGFSLTLDPRDATVTWLARTL